MFLRPLCDPRHHAHRLDRVPPNGRLGGEHQGIRPVKDRVRDVRRLRPARLRIRDHRLQHLRRGDIRLPESAGSAQDLLLEQRHVRRRRLHPQVAASHHDPVGRLDDRVQVLDRLHPLDLGDDHRRRPGVADLPTKRPDVRRMPHKGEPHHVHARLQAEPQVRNILPGEARRAERRVRQVDPFVLRELSADDHLADDLIALHAPHLELQAPVIEKDGVLAAHVRRQRLVRDGETLRRPLNLARREADAVARFEFNRLVAHQLADPHLRPLQVLENPHRPAGLLGEPADLPYRLAVPRLAAVREVQAEDVHARVNQPPNHLRRFGNRAQGRDNPRASVPVGHDSSL